MLKNSFEKGENCCKQCKSEIKIPTSGTGKKFPRAAHPTYTEYEKLVNSRTILKSSMNLL